MKINNIIWTKEIIEIIYCCLLDISDIEDQRKVWRGDFSPTRVGDYIEYNCRLYDDFFFDNFIDDYLNVIEVSKDFKDKIELLRIKLDSFDGSEMKYNKILKHPQWIEISDIAKEVLKLWTDNGLPK